ncbi:cyanophycin synthetase [Natranaerofaba carboxydovora]|uniref:cyanophycin synthetase n=1 Tax=Natranaerofaba carboxydovora TaxID=2742683 RepID=UPI001F132169|nr:cyanophycin synthetase [Natranaerofaba carboxydovora]UMZ75263.1 Cyanophycin synthetase [Natranaerofaba carboxydovora]
MKVLDKRVLRGRNIYSHNPVIKARIDLGELSEVKTNEIEGFYECLQDNFPSIIEHHCSRGYRGGFLERVKEGTLLGHVVEHVTIELMQLSNVETNYGTTRATNVEKVYDIIVEQKSSQGLDTALDHAVDIVKKMINKEAPQIEQRIKEIRDIVSETRLGPSTEAILKAAKKRDIPFIRLDDDASMFQLGFGKNGKRIQATTTEYTSCIGVDIACDKRKTNEMLDELGLPVPFGKVVETEKDAVKAANEIGFPLVLKPKDGNQGKGVTLNIWSEDEIKAAYRVALNYSPEIIVEQHVEGKHYRILVVGDKVVAGSERLPAHVVGDGENTIRKLIDLENEKNHLRGEGHEKPLSKISVDPVVNMVLARNNMTMNYVPEKGDMVYLRESANLSTGGIAIDVTEDIHPETARTAKRACKVVGLDVGGVDIVVDDIRNSIQDGGAIIEINAAPGIRMHEHPTKGEKRDVGKEIVDYLFPFNDETKIPIVSVTGTNGKTTTARLIRKVLKDEGYTVGATTTDGIFVDDELILKGDTTGPSSAKTVLTDQRVDASVFETARGGLIRGGLGYNLADVAVVTNIGEDHIGQDGIDTIEDMVNVKSLVVEATELNGKVVLNADDETSKYMAEKARGQVILFSKSHENKWLKRHIGAGGKGLFVKNDRIFWANGKHGVSMGELTSIPIAFFGLAEHNIENVLASIAASLALGVSLEKCYDSIKDFNPSIEDNPGRSNFYVCEDNDIKILIDYGHNPPGWEKILEMVAKIEKNNVRGVIGVPGDRGDDMIHEAGRVAARYLDTIIVKEDEDPRGRNKGEVAQLLTNGLETELSKELVTKDEVEVERVLCEKEAVKKAIDTAKSGDLVVVFYENLDNVLDPINGKNLNIRPAGPEDL